MNKEIEIKKNEFCFVILPNINLGKHLKEILQFQKNRIHKFGFDSIYILDLDNIIDSKTELFKNTINSIIKFKKIFANKSNKIICFIESTNPMLDLNQIEKLSLKDNEIVEIHGGIPGTTPLFVTKYMNIKLKINSKNWLLKIKPNKTVYWNSQTFSNNQFDLNRPMRLKIFLKLLEKIPDLENLSILEFLKKLNSEKIFNFILDYAEDKIRTKPVKICPYCKHKDLKSLYFTTSQPMIGFLSNKKAVYLECQNCGLVSLRKQCLMKDLHLLYDDFERPKINEKKSIENFLTNKGGTHFQEKIRSLELLKKYAPKKSSMIDLGGGFGEFACMAKKRNPLWRVHCVDFNLDHVKSILEKNNVITHNQNFLENEFGKNFDIISSLHVIEHIPVSELKKFFKNIYNSLNKNGLLLLTTPNYESPLARMFDYHMMYPPQHQTILSVGWIENFVKDLKLFKKITATTASVILEHYDDWFTYYKKTAPTDESKAVLEILDTIYNNKTMFNDFHQNLNKKNLGSESIILFKKI